MRFNPQETTGSRFRLRYSVDLHYDLLGPAQFLINVHAAKTPRQAVVEEVFEVTPEQTVTLECDPAIGNRIAKFSADAPTLGVHYAALVEVNHRIVEPSTVVAEEPVDLPVESLRYLYPSRY